MENIDTESSGSSESGRSSDVLVVDKGTKKATLTPDLSAEIALTVDRNKGERVKCRRVYGDNYRVNWLELDARHSSRGRSLALETYRIRRSRFLRVKKVGEQLMIEDVTQAAANN